jgi:predicted permease
MLGATTRTTTFVTKLPGQAHPISIRTQLVSGSYFGTLGIAVTRGRPIAGDDTRETAPPVAVVSDALWRDRLGARDDIVGRTVMVSGVTATIVGIATPGFIGTWSDARADLWLPLTMQQALQYRNNVSTYGQVEVDRPWAPQERIAWLNVFGRVPAPSRPGARAALEAANRAALADVAPALPADSREDTVSAVLVMQPFATGFSRMRAQLSDPLYALGAIVVIVLVVACANIATLLVARSAARSRELEVRMALGAGRRRLVQQGLIECSLLAGCGGVAGWVLGQWASTALASAFLSTTRDRLPEVYSPDARVLAFTVGVSVVTALLCGLLPALRLRRLGQASHLAGGTRMTSSLVRGLRPVVAAQLALALAVVFSAALLGRTLINFSRVDPGYDTRHVVSVSFNPVANGFSSGSTPALLARLTEAASAVSGVASAAASSCGLLDDCTLSGGFRIDGRAGDDTVDLSENYVGAGYFSTVGIPLVSGRDFDDHDRMGSPLVAAISRAVAARYFPGENPIGRRIGDDDFMAEIVAVVGDTRPTSLRELPVPMVYFPIRQWPSTPHNLAIRVTGNASAAVAPVRAALEGIEPGLTLDGVGAMTRHVERNVLRERLVAYLVTAFAGLTLLLGCLGLYGVLSYAVTRRMPELGVRVALGATAADLTRSVVGDALWVAAAGSAAGLVLAMWGAGLLETMLFEVSTVDPLVAVVTTAALLLSAVAASYLPARRAGRVDPLTTLRQE